MDVKRRIRIRKLIRRCVVLAAIVGVVLVEYDRNDKRWEQAGQNPEVVSGCRRARDRSDVNRRKFLWTE